MRRRLTQTTSCLLAMLLFAPVAAHAASAASGVAASAWQPAQTGDVRAQVFAWLEAKKVDASTRAKAEAMWRDAERPISEDELLDRVVQTFALADSDAARLVAMCLQPRLQSRLSGQAWLADPGLPRMFTANLRLLYARWLVQQSLYDEAHEQLAGLTPSDVVAPAALLFCQGVVDHALLNRDSGLRVIGELLDGAKSSPRRYVAVARLMQEDLKDLQDDTLDHIARRMNDIRRRLDLGRAGAKVRKQEDGVIESLDKMIKKLEEQQQQQAASTANTMRPSNPAQDSRIMEGKGPGEVTKKKIGSSSGWGDLPPKEREEAMQQIGRDLPAHYRDVIEQYFRELAAEGEK